MVYNEDGKKVKASQTGDRKEIGRSDEIKRCGIYGWLRK
ncbi:conserved domain protein [delta proteobacterium NaphS2]|nr:conserved domain protein [delta proteobacterium NaphS2]